jgi:hypothetical protein
MSRSGRRSRHWAVAAPPCRRRLAVLVQVRGLQHGVQALPSLTSRESVTAHSRMQAWTNACGRLPRSCRWCTSYSSAAVVEFPDAGVWFLPSLGDHVGGDGRRAPAIGGQHVVARVGGRSSPMGSPATVGSLVGGERGAQRAGHRVLGQQPAELLDRQRAQRHVGDGDPGRERRGRRAGPSRQAPRLRCHRRPSSARTRPAAGPLRLRRNGPERNGPCAPAFPAFGQQ